MLSLKPGVDLRGIQPAMLVCLIVADQVFTLYGETLTITSVCDSQHNPGSLHPSGNAIDCRTTAAGIKPSVVNRIAAALRERLGAQFDVVVEGDHLHIEFDPK